MLHPIFGRLVDNFKTKSALLLVLWYAVPCQSQQLADSVIKESSLRQTVMHLSQDSLKGRFTGSYGADLAAAFISSAFDAAGLQALSGNENFFDNYFTNYYRKKMPAKNVVGVIPGKISNDTMVIFSAHYDHIGQRDDLPTNKEFTYEDDIFNGANDNATGVAALLELAKYYKVRNDNRYQLLFIAFSGEEMGMLGSFAFLKKINTAIVKTVINLEMLGRPKNDNCFIISFSNSSIKKTLNQNLKEYQEIVEKPFFQNDPYPEENLSYRSDHYPFARKIKNAFTIMATSPEDLYYHSVDDEYSTIDFTFLMRATKNIALACEPFLQ